MAMQTPDQRIEELELFFKNFDTNGFTVENFISTLCVVNKFETKMGEKLQDAHTGCCCNLP